MIKFENNQWAARISEEFTFANVRQVALAIANIIPQNKPVIVSYDPRFLADRFAEEATKVLLKSGISVFFTERDTPLAIVEWEVSDKKAAGAVVFTGSDLPAEYCGIKLIDINSQKVEEFVKEPTCLPAGRDVSVSGSGKSGKIERFEPRNRYFTYLSNMIDTAAIKKAKPMIALDLSYGAGRGYLDWMLEKLGCRLEVINGQRDVLFGGVQPGFREKELVALTAKSSADLGITVSVNADRFWLIDKNGKFRGELPDGIGGAVRLVEEFARRGSVL